MAASIQEVRKQLRDLDKKQLLEICLRLAKYKKDNKELLSYLLFDADDVDGYIGSVKAEIDEAFAQVNTTHVFFAKKTLRKALRIANKHIRYIGEKTAEVEILLHYLTNFRGLPMQWQKHKILSNIYHAQLKKIETALKSLHEDLQHEYRPSLDRLKQV